MNLAYDRAQPANIHVSRKQVQRRIEPGAGVEQECEVAGENGDVLGFELAKKIKSEACARRRITFADGVDRD